MATSESTCTLECDFADYLVSYNGEVFSETVRQFQFANAGDIIVEQDIGDVGECTRKFLTYGILT